MEVKQRLYDVDELWEIYRQKDNDALSYELIEGVLVEMSAPGGVHGRIAIRLGRFLDEYAEARDLGNVTVETGYHPAGNRYTLLIPDVAFVSHLRAPEPFPEKWIPTMPELAIEIRSSSNTLSELRDKAELYLRYGAELVWIVQPVEQSVEVWRKRADGAFTSRVLRRSDSLSGENVLPGFALDLSRVFRQARLRPA